MLCGLSAAVSHTTRFGFILLFFYSMASSSTIPLAVSAAVLKTSDPVSEDAVSVQGPNFDETLSLQGFISSYERVGFQANSLGKAIHIVNKMVRFAMQTCIHPQLQQFTDQLAALG
jgi:hypothetical protein